MEFSSKNVLLIVLGAGLLAAVGAFMIYNKPHKDLNALTADVQLSATELYQAFEADETEANERFLGKLVEVDGQVQEMTETEGGGMLVVLREESDMFGVNCSFLPEEMSGTSALEIGSSVLVKGMCSGSTLAGVDLSRCVLVP